MQIDFFFISLRLRLSAVVFLCLLLLFDTLDYELVSVHNVFI